MVASETPCLQEVGCLRPSLMPLQYRDNLLSREPCSLHLSVHLLIGGGQTGPFWLEFSYRFPGWEERRTTKASSFSDAQKAFILEQGCDGIAVAEICRKSGISQSTYFNWKKKYDGLLTTEIRL